jgi:ubiquinone/menaquinone biosynthesis C-methylase UbiE
MGPAKKAHDGFEGATGRVAGAVMAHLNRDMENAAIDELDPRDGDAILAVGFGPGVGLAELVNRVPAGLIAGVDPSPTMVAQATRRNRGAVVAGRVEIARAGAEAIPWRDDRFDGVLAVNSIQLWKPLETGLTEVARVLRPGGVFVAVTHDWAIEKARPLHEWLAATTALLEERGLSGITVRKGQFRSGSGTMLRSVLLRSCNQTAPEGRGRAV